MIGGRTVQRSVFWRVLAYELSMWRSLYRWVFRRLAVSGERFPYAGAVTPVIWAFIVVSAIEVPIVHPLVPGRRRERPDARRDLRRALDDRRLASFRVHPHTVEDDGLHVWHGGTVHLLVPWATSTRCGAAAGRTRGRRSIRPLEEGSGRVLAMIVGSRTTVDLVLRHPLALLARHRAAAAGELPR